MGEGSDVRTRRLHRSATTQEGVKGGHWLGLKRDEGVKGVGRACAGTRCTSMPAVWRTVRRSRNHNT